MVLTRTRLATAIDEEDVVLLPPQDVMETLGEVGASGLRFRAAILDPWYNKGVGGFRSDYYGWLEEVLLQTSLVSEHIFLWGVPEIVARMLDRLPASHELVAWLTWYYKNCPSVIRGWRSAQFTCLHIASPGARLHPERFLNERQLELLDGGKLRYMPGPPSVIEAPLNVGFVGRDENQGHPAQKPVKTIEPLLLMTVEAGDIVLDPMCGSGTTGVVARSLGAKAILCDLDPEYVAMTERRLGISGLH